MKFRYALALLYLSIQTTLASPYTQADPLLTRAVSGSNWKRATPSRRSKLNRAIDTYKVQSKQLENWKIPDGDHAFYQIWNRGRSPPGREGLLTRDTDGDNVALVIGRLTEADFKGRVMRLEHVAPPPQSGGNGQEVRVVVEAFEPQADRGEKYVFLGTTGHLEVTNEPHLTQRAEYIAHFYGPYHDRDNNCEHMMQRLHSALGVEQPPWAHPYYRNEKGQMMQPQESQDAWTEWQVKHGPLDPPPYGYKHPEPK